MNPQLTMPAERAELSGTRTSRFAVRPSLILAAAVVVALVLRVHCLIFPYLWLDEFVTLWSIGGSSYGEMLDRALHWTASGPLFVLCYRLSCELAGNVECGVKLPGVIGGTASVWVTWWLVRRLFSRNDVALVSAWFVALAPQFIHFSQEARPYAVGALVVALATGFVAGWIRTGRRTDLVGATICFVAAVGVHLFSALAIAAANVAVFWCAIAARWPRQRWIEWIVAQCVTAIGLWFTGAQFWLLSRRHGSMILETQLPMATSAALSTELHDKLIAVAGFAFCAVAIAWLATRFPTTLLGRAWTDDANSIRLIALSYAVPTVSLTALAVARVIDCWPRYYFLFQTGFLVSFAWLVVRAFPPRLSRVAVAAALVGMLTSHNRVGGIWSCRLTGDWMTFPRAQQTLRDRVQPGDLVVSRAGLIEANHIDFLTDPLGSSYLKCFCEAKDGPLAAEHLPLPFSPESELSRSYLDRLVRERLLGRRDFWLVNMGPQDFDYRDWFPHELDGQFQESETIEFRPFFVLTRFVRTGEEVAAKK